MRLPWKNHFLPISTKISKLKEVVLFFRSIHMINLSKNNNRKLWKYQHLCYFEITLQTSFFAHISENTITFREKGHFLEITFKNRFLPVSAKISKFKENVLFFRSLDIINISKHINISRKITFFRSLFKVVFCTYLWKYHQY